MTEGTQVQAPAEVAVPAARLTSAGVIQQFIADLPIGAVASLAQLHAAVTANPHLAHKTSTEVYNDTQSLASRKKIGRGVAKQTWLRFADQNNDARTAAKEAAKAAKPVKAPRTAAAEASEEKQHADDDVLKVVVDALREPVDPRDEGGPCIILDGRMSGEEVLAAVTATLGGEPTAYSIGANGPNIALTFYRD